LNQFRTTFDIPGNDFQFGYDQTIFSVGSCFAENIAARLRHHLFDIRSNPNGILFNPISLAINLRNIINKKAHLKQELVQHNGLWHSWQHHHSCSGVDQDNMIQQLNDSANQSANHLSNTEILLVTFGTAFAYRYIKTGAIVANCHKIPNHQFEKIRLGDHRIVGEWQDTIELLLHQKPNLQIIMTVSPVRHLKDGLVENQRSKATLLLAIEALTRQYVNVHYFPSYEIMIDDLRDYRFYKTDMLHPTDEAIEYIWSRFVETYINPKTQVIMKEVDQLQKARTHRAMHPESEAAQNFKHQTENRWQALRDKYSFLTLSH